MHIIYIYDVIIYKYTHRHTHTEAWVGDYNLMCDFYVVNSDSRRLWANVATLKDNLGFVEIAS